MQGTQVQLLVKEESHMPRANEACVMQLLKPEGPQARAPQQERQPQ